jgi:hypothetical protein
MRKQIKELFMIVVIFTTLLVTSNCTKTDNPLTNQPPDKPINPTPANNETNVSNATTLGWSDCSDPENDPVTYDIYLGTTSAPVLVKSNNLINSFTPGTLLPNTKYYWKVVAKDDKYSSTSSIIWNFTTNADNSNLPPTAPINPTPAHNATNVSTATTLSWSVCTDPELDLVVYDIFLGTTSPPGMVVNNWSQNTYNPGTLTPNTKYYWKVVAKDAKNYTYSSIWIFTTGASTGGDLRVVVCDATETNYFGGAEVFLYKSDAERTSDPMRLNYFRKTTTDNSDPIEIGAVFYDLVYQKYYVFARRDLGGGNFIQGVGESFVTNGITTKLTLHVN